MKATEFIDQLKKILYTVDCPEDIEIYFDTEAASFDTHLVRISDINYLSQEYIGDNDIIVLRCSSEEYIHTPSIKVKRGHSIGKEEVYYEMFKCPSCGEDPLGEGDNFCAFCGVKLDWSELEPELEPEEDEY